MITAIRPKATVDVTSKMANHANTNVTEKFYDLDDEATELKSQGVKIASDLLRLDRPKRKVKKTNLKNNGSR